jgi:hypothetical protein
MSDDNVFIVPLAVTIGAYKLLNKAAAKQGMSAGELLAKKFRYILEELSEDIKKGDEHECDRRHH